MGHLYRRWDTPRSRFGDLVVIGFVVTQGLDGALTYLGISLWGVGVEANPIISSAVSYAGLGVGVAGAKLFAVALGIALHLCRVHYVVAILTAIYIVGAILPWTAMFLFHY
jgi:hypothetical protein